MNLLDQIKLEEGKRLKPYRDQMGWLTIGYGRNIDVNGISGDEAELMLANDLARFSQEVHVRLPWTDSIGDERRAVMVGMAMNMGTAGLLTFKKMLRLAEMGDWDGAAAEIISSRYHEQLPERAARYAAQLSTGQWARYE